MTVNNRNYKPLKQQPGKKMLCSAEDKVIIKAVLLGKIEKIDFLIAKYKNNVYSFIQKRVGDPEICEDLAQETFLAAYQSLKSFKMESKFSTWLYGIALNKIRNHFSKSNGYSFLTTSAIDHMVSEKELPLEYLEKKTEIDCLIKIIYGLKPDLKEVFFLVIFDDLSYEETADIIGIPVGTVKSRMFSARRVIKQRIRKKELLEKELV